MERFRTIIFDLDGTLFKTETVFIEAINQVYCSRGLDIINREMLKAYIGQPSAAIYNNIFGGSMNEDEIQYIRKEIRENEKVLIKKSGELYEGILNMLDHLYNEGFSLCICTNSSIQYTDNILNTFGIAKYFSIIKTWKEGLIKSQLIKQILDESACCSAIVVGDTASDFEAANETGCISIGCTYGYGKNAEQCADFTAEDPEAIYKIVKNINKLFAKVTDQIIDKKQENQPLIVGINGVDTSGKTIFTNELKRYISKMGFKVQTILMDDFHNQAKIRSQGSDPITSYIDNAFNLVRIESELLKPIKEDKTVDKELTLLDVEVDKYTNKKRYIVDKDTIVLIEGVLLYRQPIDKYFDLRIFIDISFDEVLKRAQKRDAALFGEAVAARYMGKYIPIQKLYIKNNNPKDKSDIIINNEDYLNPKIVKSFSSLAMRQDKILLEKIEKKHLIRLHEMLIDSEAREMLGVIDLPNEEEYQGKNNISYAVIGEDNKFAGIVELFNISWRNRRAELSICMNPSERGKGYGYEAIKRILNIGFKELGLYRIWLRVIENNTKAINLYKKAGFTEEGICRGESLREGKFINQIQMSMLRTEWAERRNQ